MSVRNKYREKKSLKQWEAHEVLKEGYLLEKKGKLNNYWTDPVTQMALVQFRLYNHLTRKILFKDDELEDKVFNFAHREVLKDMLA
ncbi:MAG: hypothetical protein ABIB79_03105 [archaeon]